MKYYNLLINLFKLLIENGPNEAELSAFVKTVQQTPQEAISNATIRLETLFRIYYLRHGLDTMDAYLLHFLNTLSFMFMEDLKTNKEISRINDRRCVLLMCALGLREQRQYYYLVRTVFQLFCSIMSQEDDAVSTGQADKCRRVE